MRASTVNVNTIVLFAKTKYTLGIVVCYYAEHVSDEKDSHNKNQLSRTTFNITV